MDSTEIGNTEKIFLKDVLELLGISKTNFYTNYVQHVTPYKDDSNYRNVYLKEEIVEKLLPMVNKNQLTDWKKLKIEILKIDSKWLINGKPYKKLNDHEKKFFDDFIVFAKKLKS